MKVHSLKLTIQDVHTKDSFKIAAILGTLTIDTGKTVVNSTTLKPEPELEHIQFTTALNNDPAFKSKIQGMIVEALSLRDLKIAKESGTLEHLLESVGQSSRPVVKKRVSKTRVKK